MSRMQWCHFVVQKFNGGRFELTWGIITGYADLGFSNRTRNQAAIGSMDVSWRLSPYNQSIKRQPGVGKQMLASFFGNAGHLTSVSLLDRLQDQCLHHCLPPVFQAWRQRRQKTALRGLLLYNYNASAHLVEHNGFLPINGEQLVPYLSYSPDLPCVCMVPVPTDQKAAARN